LRQAVNAVWLLPLVAVFLLLVFFLEELVELEPQAAMVIAAKSVTRTTAARRGA
jgi:EamA domain-containing membrane protein RarD